MTTVRGTARTLWLLALVLFVAAGQEHLDKVARRQGAGS